MTTRVEVPQYAHERPNVDVEAFVAGNAVVIGDVVVAAEASIWFGCVLRGDVQAIRIGARTNIQDTTVIHGTTDGRPVIIGADVTVGHGAILHACELQDGSFVGFGARVLDGAVVKTGGMLAAGSVLTPGRVVESGQLWAGNPARLLRELTNDERQAFRINVERYVRLARFYRTSHPARFPEEPMK